MISRDFPAYSLIQRAAYELGNLVEDVLFVGGATIGFYITESGVRQVRPTLDIDVVVKAVTRAEIEEFHVRLRRLGFSEDVLSGVICRWRKDELILDLMPVSEQAFGFGNRWYEAAFTESVSIPMNDAPQIRIPSPSLAIACKIEAFSSRGQCDYLASRDFEDIIAILDGRPQIVEEFALAPEEVRIFVGSEFERWIANIDVVQAISAHLPPDPASQDRRDIVIERMRGIADST